MRTRARPAEALTPRQRAIYEYLFDHTAQYGCQPTYRAIMAHFDMNSPNAVLGHLRLLRKKSYIALQPRGDGGSREGVWFLRQPDGTPFRGFIPK